MSNQPSEMTKLDRSPLTENDRLLLRAAEMQPWTWPLKAALAEALRRRGMGVGRFDSPGDLADALRLVARDESPDSPKSDSREV